MTKKKWFFFTQRHTTEHIQIHPDDLPSIAPGDGADTLILGDPLRPTFPCELFLATLAVQWVSGFSKPLHTHSPLDPCVGLHLSVPRTG